MPRGIASATDTTTATMTWLSVSIDSSHIPSTPTAAMHANASTARPHRRDTRQPINAAKPATIHHGTSVSRFFNGSSAYFTVTLVIAVVTPPNVREDPRQRVVHGSLDVHRPRRREVLLAQAPGDR